MPELNSPAWLLLLPPLSLLIHWLHRFRSRGILLWVPAVFLWRGLPVNSSQGRKRKHPDPAWRRRALIAALLLIALAEPVWTDRPGRSVSVWLDDSLSMQTREQGQSRIELAARRLLDLIHDEGVNRVTLHSLSGSRTTLALEMDTQAEEAQQQLQQWLARPWKETAWQLPPLPLPSGEHWLITDGAGEGLQAWLTDGRIARVILVGKERENSALTQLSLRRSISRPGVADGLVTVSNPGSRAAVRQVTVETGSGVLGEWTLSIPPGDQLSRRFSLPLTDVRLLEAGLSPVDDQSADPLPLDDTLTLRLPESGWRFPLRLTGECSQALISALVAIPGLKIQQSPGPLSELIIACSPVTPATAAEALIWFRQPASPKPVSAPLQWQPAAKHLARIDLSPDLLLTDSTSAPVTGEPLLSAGGEALIILQRLPESRLEVRLAMDQARLTRQPQYPLLVSGLVELALGERVLDGILVRQRDAADSRIAGRPLQIERPRGIERVTTRRLDLSGWLLLLVLALLIYDIGRILPGLRPPTAAIGRLQPGGKR